ncbi:MAG: hypothetical protein QXJ11_06200 [Candidatus Bathyarchaeia archaeon]
MYKKWFEKNVDLALLTEHIGNFFKTKDFEAIRGETPNGYQILAANSPRFFIEGYICLTIEGKPENFTVKCDLCRKDNDNFFLLNPITRMFIGGYWFLRKLKSDETWRKLEKELEQYIENVVSYLAGSSSSG